MLLKAVAGGGGKGMRRVDREAELESSLRDAASEAERAFRNAEVYVEKLISVRATSRFNCSATVTATWCTWASANAPFSGGIKR